MERWWRGRFLLRADTIRAQLRSLSRSEQAKVAHGYLLAPDGLGHPVTGPASSVPGGDGLSGDGGQPTLVAALTMQQRKQSAHAGEVVEHLQ